MKMPSFFTALALVTSLLPALAHAGDPLVCTGPVYTATLKLDQHLIDIQSPERHYTYILNRTRPVDGGTSYSGIQFLPQPYHAIILTVTGDDADLLVAGQHYPLSCSQNEPE